MKICLGDRIETKKPHPCGGTQWEVVRIGADCKIKCCTCSRVVMLTTDDLKKRIKRILPEGGKGE